MRKINGSWYSMKKTGDASAEIMLYNDIGYFGITAEAFVKSLSDLGEIKDLTVRINSYGGEVFDGFAIYNRLRESKAHKVVIVDGVAASIASVIAMAGDEVKVPKNAFFMIHDPSIMIAGTAKELTVAVDLLKELKSKAITIYRDKIKRAGAKEMSESEIADMMEKETWINAENSVIYGLADDVIDETDNEEPVTNKKIRLPESLKEVFLSLNKTQPSGMKTPTMNKGGSMKVCPHCKKEINENAVFCQHCGKAIAAASPDPELMAAAHKKELEDAREETAKNERKRVQDISAACRKYNMTAEVEKELIESGESYEKATAKILEKIAVPPISPKTTDTHTGTFITVDGDEKFRTHLTNSLAVSNGLEKDQKVIDEVRKDVQVSTLHGAMRVCLQRKGVDSSFMTPEQLVDKTLRMIGTSSSDLPAALEAVANKSLTAGFAEAPTTYQQFVATREVNDFKTNNIVSVSNFADLDIIPEGGQFRDAKISDKKETYSINTKGKKYTISRNALINDDMDVFSRIPRLMGAAVPRKINRDVYDQLCSASLAGPTMNEDSQTLFETTYHHNVVANSGSVSVSSIAAAQRKLMEMPLPKAEPDTVTQYANITGRYLITGSANMIAITQVLGSGMDISKSIPGVLNPYAGGVIIPIFDAYLQALLTAQSKSNAFYLAADPMALETIGVAYLRGNRTPTFRSANSPVGEALGLVYDIFFDWGIYFADYRGLIYNDGVTTQ